MIQLSTGRKMTAGCALSAGTPMQRISWQHSYADKLLHPSSLIQGFSLQALVISTLHWLTWIQVSSGRPRNVGLITLPPSHFPMSWLGMPAAVLTDIMVACPMHYGLALLVVQAPNS